MEQKNLLRMAVESRKQHLIRRLMTIDGYAEKEDYLSSLTLSELEEEWQHHDRLRGDQIS